VLRRLLGFTVAGLMLVTAPACAQSSEIEALRREIADLREDLASLRSSLGRSRAIITLDSGHQKGNPEALIALIEFSDYQCPFCARHTRETMPLIEKDFIATGRVLYGFRDFPIDQLHPQAIRAHEATQCAGDQKKYWEMHGRMFGDPSQHTPEGLEGAATAIGLDLNAFRACVAAGTHTAAIRENVALAESFGANGTPAFFIGIIDKATNSVRVTRAITGAVPYAQFAQTLEAALAQAQKQP
jgi:protein-disulfide isomerase